MLRMLFFYVLFESRQDDKFFVAVRTMVYISHLLTIRFDMDLHGIFVGESLAAGIALIRTDRPMHDHVPSKIGRGTELPVALRARNFRFAIIV